MNNQTELGIPLALIAAMAANGVIGKDNALPWHLPEDLAWFRKVTMGKPIVMGRRTFESIGRPLPGRDNIVVSTGMDDPPAGVLVCASPEAAVETARRRAAALGAGEVMLIGGGQLYRWAMPHTQRMYLTLIHCEIDGDAWFPDWETRDWRTVERTDLTSGQGLDYSLLVLDRNR